MDGSRENRRLGEGGVDFTTHPNAKKAAVYFKLDQAANGAAWVDDLELSEVVTVVDAKLTPNSIDVTQAGRADERYG